MILHSSTAPTLLETIWSGSSIQKYLTMLAVGVGLLFLSAKVSIPFVPVPMSMQTFVVLALGLVYGWKLAGLTVISYLILGAYGLPVFQGTPERGVGVAYMVGPTGGYLLGFVLAAMTTGFLAEKGWDRKVITTFLAMVIGNVVIYVPGLIWLANVVGWDKPILQWGLLPFIWGDLVKIVIAVMIIPASWKKLKSDT